MLGKTVGTLDRANRPIGDGTLIVRWIWVVDVIVALGALAGLLAPAEPHQPRAAHARGGGGLPDGADARRAREPDDL